MQIDILPRVDSKERLRKASVLKDTQKAAMAAGADEICHLIATGVSIKAL